MWSAVIVAAAVCSCGCRSLSFVPRGMVRPYLDGMVASLKAQPDPDLVKEGTPAFLLLLDGLVTASPDNVDLLRAAATAYDTYCQAFLLQDEASAERASCLYGRAKDYGQALLRQRRFYRRAEDGDIEAFEAALLRFRRRDVPDLYTAGSTWLGWIASSPDSMQALVDLPKAMAVMRRVLELDEGHQDGSAHLFLGIYYASQPPGAGQDLDKSRGHFERALELAGPGSLLPRVVFAEAYGKATLDEEFFTRELTAVVEADESLRPEIRLLNAVAKRRATDLLAQVEDIF